MRKSIATAPGKLMLFGEHAVQYGSRPCLVTAVDVRTSVTAESLSGGIVEIHSSTDSHIHRYSIDQIQTKRATYPGSIVFVMETVSLLLDRMDKPTGFRLTTEGPRNSFGLGSSSAVTVATVGSLAGLFGIDLSARDTFDLAYQAVLKVQGSASGFDVASAVYGGTLYYAAGGRTIEPLDAIPWPLVVSYSGSKGNTVENIRRVAALHASHPWIVEPVFSLMAGIVDEARRLFVRGEWSPLGQLMDVNQGLLDSLGINTGQLSQLVFAARAAGACGAKLSGAGGGDCMYALTNTENAEQVRAALADAGGQVVDVSVHASGLRLEDE